METIAYRAVTAVMKEMVIDDVTHNDQQQYCSIV